MSRATSGLVIPAGIWRHYKGGYYLVLGIAEDGEDGSRDVIYVSLTGAKLPGPRMRKQVVERFLGTVTVGRLPTQRFEYVGLEIPPEEAGKVEYDRA